MIAFCRFLSPPGLHRWAVVRILQTMTRHTTADRAAAELRAIVSASAPDYVAPALTALLVETARKIGLSQEAVIEQITTLWALHAAADR